MPGVPFPPGRPGRPGSAQGPGGAGNWPGDEDWDQEASLAAFVAAAESGQCQPPPGDCGPGGGAGPLAMPAGGLPEGLWQFIPAADGGPAGGRWQPIPLDQDGIPLLDEPAPGQPGDQPSTPPGGDPGTPPGGDPGTPPGDEPVPGPPGDGPCLGRPGGLPSTAGQPPGSNGRPGAADRMAPGPAGHSPPRGHTGPGRGSTRAGGASSISAGDSPGPAGDCAPPGSSPQADGSAHAGSSPQAGSSAPGGGDALGVPAEADGAGAGFDSGGVHDTALPGPGLAAAVDAAAGPGWRYRGFSDDQLIGALVAWQKTEAWAAAGKLAACAELIRRRPDEHGHGQLSPSGAPPACWGKYADDEAAAALSISSHASGRALALAHDLAARLPRTAQALREGVIDAYKAQVIAETLRVLDEAAAAAAEQLLFADDGAKITGKTPSQIRVAAGRAAAAADPEAARKRREETVKDARVELWREDAGTAALCGFHLPPDEALAADQQITALARALKAAGLAGGMDAARVRAYLDILLGKNTLATLAAQQGQQDAARPGPGQDPAGPHGPGAGTPGQAGTPGGGSSANEPGLDGPPDFGGHAPHCPDRPDRPDGPGQGTPDSGRPATTAGTPVRQPGSPAPSPGGIPARVNLTIPVATLLGLAGRPGEAAGFGPLDPALARTLAAAAAADPRSTWCLTVTDQHGHPLAHGCARPGRPRASAKDTSPDGDRNTGPPGRDSTGPRGSDSTGPRGTDSTGPPGSDSAGPGGTAVQGPAGQSGTARPAWASFTFTPAPGRGRTGRWHLHTPAGRHYTIDVEPLAVTGCDHRHSTPAYQPGDKLRHLVSIRDGECTWPPCRRAAERCDLDHTIPHDQGGPTCGCNLAARCRHHHHQKQAPGWQARQDQPGSHTWTTPAGRTYTSEPTTYPI